MRAAAQHKPAFRGTVCTWPFKPLASDGAPDGLDRAAWRKARRKGSLRDRRGREEARRETGRTQPADADYARAWRLEHESHTAHTILDVQGKVAGLLGLTSNTERALDGGPTACGAGRRGAGLPSTGRVTGDLLPRQRSTPGHQQPRPTPARTLCEAEREQILDVLAGPRFVDRAPAEVVATLLDEGHYLCSERTMYRILAADQPVRERRNQREHPQYTKPELVATAPNQTWSWDITKLLGPTKWTYFYLYVVLDIFSRYAVGWMVADRENSALAGRLIEETCHKQGVQPQVLTLHSDRGAPMTSKCTAQLLADLGVTRSLSRPQVSDDNPFSEAQFKTLKYHPGFPGRFHDITAAIAFCRTFFPWYNTEHRHGGIAMLTPDDVHHNRTQSVLKQRGRTLQAAWTRHPERFVRGIPQPHPLPQAVWINPPVTHNRETAQ